MNKVIILLVTLIFLTACTGQQATIDMSKKIRQPAVAGQFYPNEPGAISEQIQRFLKQASPFSVSPLIRRRPAVENESNVPLLTKEGLGEVKAIIVPHAGYDFSGAVAAYAFKALAGRKINTVVIIGNSHKAYFDGAVIDDNDAWQTPLGRVVVDKEMADKLIAVGGDVVKFDGAPHRDDHNLEVELPFLQTVLESGFKIVPIEFGNKNDGSYKKLAKALKDNLGENDLVVISTDMSHYPKYEDANKIDLATLKKIKGLDVAELEKHVVAVESAGYANEQTVLCGIDAVRTVMELYNLAGWDKIEVLKYANSGDVAGIGDKRQVVGYGAVAFGQSQKENANTIPPTPSARGGLQFIKGVKANATSTVNELNIDEQKVLLKIAKETVESFVATGKIPEFDVADERLKQRQGAFVTLNKNGQLRGCIGQIVPSDEPLWQVVRDMAVAACSEDGRFSPVGKDELSELEYEVSVLSKPEPISDWRKIELGKHGVILGQGGNRGVFLPQVATETGWSLDEFLSQLCWQKAGLAPSCYKDKDTEIQVFTAQVFK